MAEIQIFHRFKLQAVAQSEIVECKDGLKFRSKDDPTSWPLTLDQPDPVMSPNPEAEIDNAGDSTSGTGSTSVSTAAVPAKTLTEKLSNPKATLTTSLNPNVPEFVPMASKVLTFLITYLSVKLLCEILLMLLR